MDYQFPVWLDVYEVDEYHSFVTGGFGASMVDTVEPIVNVDEHTMPGSGHDAALLCVLLHILPSASGSHTEKVLLYFLYFSLFSS